MKIKEFYENIQPMVDNLDKGTSVFMLCSDNSRECGAIRGIEKDIITLLVDQMVKDERIERIIMVAAEAFIDYAEHQKKLANNPTIS